MVFFFLFGLVKLISGYQNLKSTCPKGYQGFWNFASPVSPHLNVSPRLIVQGALWSTWILGADIFRPFLSISQVYLNVIFKYISEKYIKSRLKVYFPIFSLKEVY